MHFTPNPTIRAEYFFYLNNRRGCNKNIGCLDYSINRVPEIDGKCSRGSPVIIATNIFLGLILVEGDHCKKNSGNLRKQV
jgi:hypothetical protein